MRVMADATEPKTLAAQVYRIGNKRLRIPVLAFVGLGAFANMLPHLGELRRGGAFGLVAIAR